MTLHAVCLLDGSRLDPDNGGPWIVSRHHADGKLCYRVTAVSWMGSLCWPH